MALTKADFVNSKSARVESTDVPELGGECFIRVLSARDRDAYDSSVYDGVTRNLANLSARLVVLCLCDETGERLFADAVEGARILGDMPTPIIERLFHECRKLNGMGVEALEQAVKNFEHKPDADSSTD